MFILEEGINALPWTDETRQWQRRVELVYPMDKQQWPDVSDKTLLTCLGNWLTPYLDNITRELLSNLVFDRMN